MTDDSWTRLCAVLRDALDAPELEVTETTSADQVDNWDSVAQVTLMFALEDEFEITFPPEGTTAYADVGDLHRAIQRLQAP